MKSKNISFQCILLLFFFMIACEGPQGDPGPIGPQGDPGPIGPQGEQGQQGEEGKAGTDGNSIVHTYIYNFPEWDFGPTLNIRMEDILTDDIIKNDVILGYIKHIGVSGISYIPGAVWVGGNYRNYTVHIHGESDPLFSQTYSIISFEMDGSFTSMDSLKRVEWVKIIIIESTNTTTSSGNSRIINPQQAIYDELWNANVDIRKYYDVMKYYGLDY